MKEAFYEAGELCKKYGFNGLHIQAEYRYEDTGTIERLKKAGYDQHFAYCWQTKQQFPTSEQAIEHQMEMMNLRKMLDPNLTFTISSLQLQKI